MRKALLVGLAALFMISIAGLAQTPSPAPLSQEALAAILGQPAVTGEYTPQADESALAMTKSPLPEKAACTATANCPFGVRVTCSGTTSCTSTDGTSCSAEGHVTCNGHTTSCNTCYVSCRCGGFSDAFCRANC
jgi:hypothetical protein